MRDNGGPAFPRTVKLPNDQATISEVGMSQRDYFAAQAMTGLLHIGAKPDASPMVIAEYAYKFADAMLAERAKGGQ